MKQAGKREVTEINNCVRIVEIHVYEDWQGAIGPIYENDMILEDGRHVIKRSLFINKRGDLFCESRVVPVNANSN